MVLAASPPHAGRPTSALRIDLVRMLKRTCDRSCRSSSVRGRCIPPAFLHASRCEVILACIARTTCTDGNSHGVSSRGLRLSPAECFFGVAPWLCICCCPNLRRQTTRVEMWTSFSTKHAVQAGHEECEGAAAHLILRRSFAYFLKKHCRTAAARFRRSSRCSRRRRARTRERHAPWMVCTAASTPRMPYRAVAA
jgi:hypothetical protein